jgi:hypothetical protein
MLEEPSLIQLQKVVVVELQIFFSCHLSSHRTTAHELSGEIQVSQMSASSAFVHLNAPTALHKVHNPLQIDIFFAA